MKMKKSPGRCRVLAVVPAASRDGKPIVTAKTRTLMQCVREESRGYLVPFPLIRRTWVHIPDGPKCPPQKRAQIIREARRWWITKRHQWTSSYQLGRVYPRRAQRPKLAGHWGPVVVGCAVIDTEQSRFVEHEDFQMSKGVS